VWLSDLRQPAGWAARPRERAPKAERGAGERRRGAAQPRRLDLPATDSDPGRYTWERVTPADPDNRDQLNCGLKGARWHLVETHRAQARFGWSGLAASSPADTR